MKLDIDELPLPLLMIDHQQVIQLANTACCALFGYEAQELVGQNINILLPANVHILHTQKVQEYLKHPIRKQLGTARDLYGKNKDGSVVPIEIGLYPYGAAVMALIIDITQGRKFGVST